MGYMEKHLNKEEYIGFLKGKILECFMTDKKNTMTDMQDVQQYAKQLEELCPGGEEARPEKYKAMSKEQLRYFDKMCSLKMNPDEYQIGDYIVYVDSHYPYEFREGIIVIKDDNAAVVENQRLQKIYVFLYSEGFLFRHTPKLKYNEWYNAPLFTKEELDLLLPPGTLIEALENRAGDVLNTASWRTDEAKVGKVKSIQKYYNYTNIYVDEDEIAYYWFKIVNQQEE